VTKSQDTITIRHTQIKSSATITQLAYIANCWNLVLEFSTLLLLWKKMTMPSKGPVLLPEKRCSCFITGMRLSFGGLMAGDEELVGRDDEGKDKEWGWESCAERFLTLSVSAHMSWSLACNSSTSISVCA
jgi:hypothetical protein